MMLPPPPPVGGTRSTAVPVTGRPSRGRLYVGTPWRGRSEPDDAAEGVLPEVDREPPPLRDTARSPVLEPLPRER